MSRTRYLQRMVTRVPKAGRSLRRIRDELGLTMRDVNARSRVLAKRKHNRDYTLTLAALSEMEAKGKVPHLYRMASLAHIYRQPLQTLIALYWTRPGRQRKRRR